MEERVSGIKDQPTVERHSLELHILESPTAERHILESPTAERHILELATEELDIRELATEELDIRELLTVEVGAVQTWPTGQSRRAGQGGSPTSPSCST